MLKKSWPHVATNLTRNSWPLLFSSGLKKQLVYANMLQRQVMLNVGFRGKHEVYDRLLTGTQVDFQ